jgi:uncharacterized protein (UPF0335 family)
MPTRTPQKSEAEMLENEAGNTDTSGTDAPGAAAASRARQAADPETKAKTGGIAADRLISIVERVERLEAERKALGDDIKDVFAEAKSAGFDVPVLKQLLALRKKDPGEIEEQETLLDVYRRALGM